MNSGDNNTAAEFFAADSKVIAGDSIRLLRTHRQAVAFNASLAFAFNGRPCSGRIDRLIAKGAEVTARFTLAGRAAGRNCPERGSIFFRVRDGKIVLFDQIGA